MIWREPASGATHRVALANPRHTGQDRVLLPLHRLNVARRLFHVKRCALIFRPCLA